MDDPQDILNRPVNAHVPTVENQKLIAAYVIAGLTQTKICEMVGLSNNILKKYYQDVLDYARELLVSKAVTQIHKKVDEGNLDAIKFVLARQGGWTEKTEHSIEVIPLRSVEEIEAELKELGVPEESLDDI